MQDAVGKDYPVRGPEKDAKDARSPHRIRLARSDTFRLSVQLFESV